MHLKKDSPAEAAKQLGRNGQLGKIGNGGIAT